MVTMVSFRQKLLPEAIVKYTTHLGLDLEFPELANEVFEEDSLHQ